MWLPFVFVYFSHDFLSVIYKIINNTQDITFGEYISVQFYKQYKSHKTADDYSRCLCVFLLHSIWSFAWQKHDANFDMHIVFFFFYLIESNWIHVFFRFFSRHCCCFDQCLFFAQIEFVSDVLYTCWRLNYGSCLVHWTKVVIYWFVFICFVRWLLMTSSKREYSHSLIFWNELHKECYKLAIESYDFNLFRPNWTFFLYISSKSIFFQFIFGLHNLIFASDINKNYDQLLRDIDSDRDMHFGCAKCTTVTTIAQKTQQTISKSEMMRSLARTFTHSNNFYSNSPSLFGFSAAAAKHRGHDAVKSTSLCNGIPFLKRINGCLLLRISFWFDLALSATKKRKRNQNKDIEKKT